VFIGCRPAVEAGAKEEEAVAVAMRAMQHVAAFIKTALRNAEYKDVPVDSGNMTQDVI